MVERPDDGVALRVAVEEERVQIGKKAITDVERLSRRIGHRAPNGRVLRLRPQGVMIARERVEGAQLHPPLAQRLRRVEEEAANVRTDVRYAEQIELEHSLC